jgi:peptidoglycan/LPS O-acetylase OafA/YrhL
MNEQLLSLLDQPSELEKLYRKNKKVFTESFNQLYPSLQGNPLADAWHERLNFESEGVQWGTKGDWQFIVIAGLLAGTLAKFPALFDIKDEFFYPRNLGFVVFPFLYAYFIRKNKLPLSAVLVPIITTLLAACYINFLPESETTDTLFLACIHMPLFLWGMLGFVYSGSNLKDLNKRLSYLNYNGETIIVGGILILAGGLLSGITNGLFGLIGLDITEVYFQYIVVYGLALAPLLATLITQTNPELVNKVPPIVAKIFSPLILVMLLSYLVAIVYAGKDPYSDRDFLLLFNLLLLGVMALIFFSVVESVQENKVGLMTWVLASLSLVTLVVNGIALSAIAFRISEWGITPNRLAVLGGNLVMIVHLVMVSRQLILTVRGKSKLDQVGLTLVRYLPIYLLWTARKSFAGLLN